MPEAAGAASRVAELVDFACRALPTMQLEDGAFCHEVVAPGERRSGGRLGRGPAVAAEEAMRPLGRSPRYTLMVAIGAGRAQAAGLDTGLDLGAARTAADAAIDHSSSALGDLGLLTWEGARSRRGAGAGVVEALGARLADEAASLETHELAWIVTGCAEAIAAGTEPAAEGVGSSAASLLLERAQTPSGLLREAEGGARTRFPHFATQAYGVLALARAAILGGTRCAEAGRRAADVLLQLQRPDGAWPWIFDVHRGTVVEPYRLYSVHQDAMAPMALFALSEVCGEESYRRAALEGLEWVWGGNELGAPMLDREAGMLYRSINRAGLRDRFVLWLNLATGLTGRPWLADHRGRLEIERTDRPYHLGWVLEAWSDWSSAG